MFGTLGFPELLVIFVIALIIFGPRKLPEIGKSLGKSLAEFKKASNELRNTLEEEIRVEEQRANVEASKTAAEASSQTPPAPHATDPHATDPHATDSHATDPHATDPHASAEEPVHHDQSA